MHFVRQRQRQHGTFLSSQRRATVSALHQNEHERLRTCPFRLTSAAPSEAICHSKRDSAYLGMELKVSNCVLGMCEIRCIRDPHVWYTSPTTQPGIGKGMREHLRTSPSVRQPSIFMLGECGSWYLSWTHS